MDSPELGHIHITLHQTICLPAGKYRLTADVWKSGLGGDVSVNVAGESSTLASSPSLENKTAWQKVDFTFNTDGTNITVNLTAMHNTNGNEKIIGFDNISITPTEEDGFLLGDANCDGSVDISDVVLAVNHILGSGAVKNETNTDTNKDESIDISDIVGIVNLILSETGSTSETDLEEDAILWGIYPGIEYGLNDGNAIASYVGEHLSTMMNYATKAIGADSSQGYASSPLNFYSFFVAYPTQQFPEIWLNQFNFDTTPFNQSEGKTVNVTWSGRSYNVWVMYNRFNDQYMDSIIKIKTN